MLKSKFVVGDLMTKLDFDFNFIKGKASTVIYFDRCNMKCKWCNHQKMLQLKNLKNLRVDRLIGQLKMSDCVVFTGGEPTIYRQSIRDYLTLLDENDFKGERILFTNLTEFNEEYIELFDKIVVDVKGRNAKEIEENTGYEKFSATSLIERYFEYQNHPKFEFRENEIVNPSNPTYQIQNI